MINSISTDSFLYQAYSTGLVQQTAPILATIAPPGPIASYPSTLDTTSTVEGSPQYDHIGHLRHKHRLLWRRRLVAIQGHFLLYFRNIEQADMTPEDLVHVVDLRKDVQLVIDPTSGGPRMVKVGNGIEWRPHAVAFSIVGEEVPNGGMYFQSVDPAESETWCKALLVGINGHCARCVTQPAKSPEHKYCFECTIQRRKEKEDERNMRACSRLRSLLLSSSSDLNLTIPVNSSSHIDTRSLSGPSISDDHRHGLLAPISSSLLRGVTNVMSEISEKDSELSSIGMPSASSNWSLLSTGRFGGRVPGMFPSAIARLPEHQWGKQGSFPASIGDRCSICDQKFEENCKVTAVPRCSHLFHSKCLADRLIVQGSCPECYVEVVIDETSHPAES